MKIDHIPSEQLISRLADLLYDNRFKEKMTCADCPASIVKKPGRMRCRECAYKKSKADDKARRRG